LARLVARSPWTPLLSSFFSRSLALSLARSLSPASRPLTPPRAKPDTIIKQVGDRYDLIRLLGCGSFSSVCLAVDRQTGEQVALKRVADVLSSPEAARKTLREVCILRRLTAHPCVIRLLDAFVRPSTAGPRALSPRTGELEPLSVDVFLALEPATDGDLFSLRGHVSAATARLLVGQLASALEYLHANGVWHRDLKSSNVLLFRDGGGKLVAKLADFGSARSAVGGGGGVAAAAAAAAGKGGGDGGGPASSFHHSDSFAQALDEAAARPEDLFANPMREEDGEVVEEEMEAADGGAATREETAAAAAAKTSNANGANRKKGGWAAPLTRLVATPLYRAPEVCLGRVERYSSAIDMWSLG